MENLSSIFGLIRGIWDNVFALEWPGVGITFKGIFFGTVVASFVIWIIKFAFGLGVDISRGRMESSIRARIDKSERWHAENPMYFFYDSFDR